jgi:hypothetical protein
MVTVCNGLGRQAQPSLGFDSKDGSSIILENVGERLFNNTATHPIRFPLVRTSDLNKINIIERLLNNELKMNIGK